MREQAGWLWSSSTSSYSCGGTSLSPRSSWHSLQQRTGICEWMNTYLYVQGHRFTEAAGHGEKTQSILVHFYVTLWAEDVDAGRWEAGCCTVACSCQFYSAHRARAAPVSLSVLSSQNRFLYLTAGTLATRKAAVGFLLTPSPLGCGVPHFQALPPGLQFPPIWLL